jgi:hypothetical protein
MTLVQVIALVIVAGLGLGLAWIAFSEDDFPNGPGDDHF